MQLMLFFAYWEDDVKPVLKVEPVKVEFVKE
jgi:hypothetical protein